jgi:hypothetical protein
MSIDKKSALIALAWFVIGAVCGFFMGKARYDKPIVETVTRDTVTIVDTIPHYYPKPVEVEKVRTEYKWLTRVVAENVGQEKISVDSASFSAKIPQDSVLVEVPIESKHYHADEYDAYVSGYLPSLDSIFVYREKEYITETITRMKPPNKWELDAVAGIDYNVKTQRYTPYAGGELLYKPSRFQFGIRGGVSKIENTGKLQPSIGGVVKVKIF